MKYQRRPILYVHNYSFIKRPISIEYGGRKHLITKKASGIVINYEYLGLGDDWKKTMLVMKKLIKRMRSKKYNYVKAIEKVKITVGFEL